MPLSQTIAYLGPAGTYTDLALRDFDPSASRLPCSSISEVFEHVIAGTAAAGFVPLENKIEGAVTATLDSLLRFSGRIFIADAYIFSIEHALGIISPPDIEVSLEHITHVYSHPQPLAQCSDFLHNTLPRAALVPTPSTSAAVAIVIEQNLTSAAVIGPAETLQAAGLKIASRSIANIPDNQTKFIVLRKGAAESHLGNTVDNNSRFVTSVVIDPGRDRQGLLFEVLELISVRHGINLMSIHSRPDGRGGFVFHLDLEGHAADPKVQACLDGLRHYSLHSTGQMVEIHVFGSYPLVFFHRRPFDVVGIIGGEGVMGRWFTNFFSSVGVQVRTTDKNSTEPLSDFIKACDVILLSVPIAAVAEVVKQAAPHLLAGQLIVENCSIKNVVLPLLLELAPPGVEVLGIHTMFGGSAGSLRGENVIFTPTERSADKSRAFEDLFYKYGAVVSHASSTEHDRASAYLQSLLHLVLLSLGEVLHRDFRSFASLENFSTPNFRAVLAAMTRVAKQDPQLLADLQTENCEGATIRHRFLEVFFRHTTALDHNNQQDIIDAAATLQEMLADKEQ